MRKLTAAALLFLSTSLAGVPSALALNPQPEPPGVLTQVSIVLYPVLPPNPCMRIPSLGLPGIIPCVVPGR